MGGGPRSSPLHVVLLAGGSGTRFWPASRAAWPKQFLALTGSRSLLQESWDRARRLVPVSRLWVVAPRALAPSLRRHLVDLRADRLVVEPAPRDTAPAVALACARVAAVDSAAIVAIFPTDQVVQRPAAFVRAVRRGVSEARDRNALVCLGIRPDRPATGFGYLRCERPPRGVRAVAVRQFVEKPDLRRARRFLRSGEYLWNAGMFIWRATRFLEELRRTAPDVLRGIEDYLAGRRGAWDAVRRVSVDFGVMEHANDVWVVPLDAGWDDVGSWDAAARLRPPEDQPSGSRHLLIDSERSAVFGGSRFVALVGVEDVVVVDTPDALLVVARSAAESVKRVVEELRARRRTDLV